MSIFETLFSPIDKWREEPKRTEQPPTCNQQIQNINKIERIKVEGLEGITISAKTNVIISSNQTDEIVVRIHGMATTNYTLNAYVTQIEKGICIKAKGQTNPTEIIALKKTEKNSKLEQKEATHSFANITLEVEIPEKSGIKWIRIKNSNGDIICKSSINVDVLDVINENGSIQITSTFSQLSIMCRTGNVSVRTIAKSNIQVDITSSDGSVLLNTINIGRVFLSYQLDGASFINPGYSGEFEIAGKIATSKGGFIYS